MIQRGSHFSRGGGGVGGGGGGGVGFKCFFYRNTFNIRCSGGGGGGDPLIPSRFVHAYLVK